MGIQGFFKMKIRAYPETTIQLRVSNSLNHKWLQGASTQEKKRALAAAKKLLEEGDYPNTTKVHNLPL